MSATIDGWGKVVARLAKRWSNGELVAKYVTDPVVAQRP